MLVEYATLKNKPYSVISEFENFQIAISYIISELRKTQTENSRQTEQQQQLNIEVEIEEKLLFKTIVTPEFTDCSMTTDEHPNLSAKGKKKNTFCTTNKNRKCRIVPIECISKNV